MMEKNPGDRPQNCQEILSVLAKILASLS